MITVIYAPASFELPKEDEPFVRFVNPSPLQKVLLAFDQKDSGVEVPESKAPPLIRVDDQDISAITALAGRSVLREGVVVVHPDPVGFPDPGWNAAVGLSPLKTIDPPDLSQRLRAQGVEGANRKTPYVPRGSAPDAGPDDDPDDFLILEEGDSD